MSDAQYVVAAPLGVGIATAGNNFREFALFVATGFEPHAGA